MSDEIEAVTEGAKAVQETGKAVQEIAKTGRDGTDQAGHQRTSPNQPYDGCIFEIFAWLLEGVEPR